MRGSEILVDAGGRTAGRAIATFVLKALACAALAAPLWSGVAQAQTDYTQYLGGARHPSWTANAAITTTSAKSLHVVWSFTVPPATQANAPKGGLFSSPSVYNHRLYIGGQNGTFYAISTSSGSVLWSRFLGYQPSLTCTQPLGFVASAAVATVPNSTNTGTTPVAYTAAPDGYLYALDGITGVTRWKSAIAIPSTTANDYFNWSSPTIVGNRIYVGFSSNCDQPWVRGGLAEFDRTTGARIATYYSVPAGSIGGGVWTSAAATTNDVWVTTGSTCPGGSASGCTATNNPGDSYSLVRLDAATLGKRFIWTIPSAELHLAGDPDFGSSPVVFNAVVNGVSKRFVGACDKDGYFYALNDNLTLAWKRKVGTATSDGGDACLASATYDNQGRLFLSGNTTSIGGVSYQGAVRRVDPATGATIWARGLSANVLGTPSENGAGVLAVPEHDFVPSGLVNETVLLDAATGAVLARLPVGKEFSQPVFADQFLFVTNAYNNTIYAYGP